MEGFAPIYLHDMAYAMENHELGPYADSKIWNDGCKIAVEASLRMHKKRSKRFDAKSAVDCVVKYFGQERVAFILAVSVDVLDKRKFSAKNRKWASTVPIIPATKFSLIEPLRRAWVVSVRPERLNRFITVFRKRYKPRKHFNFSKCSNH